MSILWAWLRHGWNSNRDKVYSTKGPMTKWGKRENCLVKLKLQKQCDKIKSRVHNTVGAAAAAKSLQSCPTLCDPIDGSPPGSPVPGILQARTLGCWLPFPSPMHESEK